MRAEWLAVIVGCWLGLSTGIARAVVVFFKDDRPPAMGFLQREDAQRVVLREVLPDGRRRDRVILRSEIDDLVRTVSTSRLRALRPEAPQEYRDYAEELAEKRRDPEAREAAIRLYLIAAHLDPRRLGRSSLLGMVDLAETAEQRRKFRVLAFLLDPDHRDDVLAGLSASTASGSGGDDSGTALLLQTLRLLRRGNRSAAAQLVERPEVAERLAGFRNVLTLEQLREACRPTRGCSHCDHGAVPCELCKGSGVDPFGVGGGKCAGCGGSGRVACPWCGGDYRLVGPPPSVLRRMLTVEMALTGPEEGSSELGEEGGGRSWRRSVLCNGAAPVPVLRLETLTPFDPRQCVFRDEKWVAP